MMWNHLQWIEMVRSYSYILSGHQLLSNLNLVSVGAVDSAVKPMYSDWEAYHTPGVRVTFNNLEGDYDESSYTPSRDISHISKPREAQRRESLSISGYTYESDIDEFSPDYALTLLQRFQEMDEFEDWCLKVDEPNVRLWTAKKGSFLNNNLPFIHSEMVFHARYPFEMVVEAIDIPEKKRIWDDNIKQVEVKQDLSIDEALYHTVYRDIPFVATWRDFLEKKLTFATWNTDGEDVFVSLSSSIPDEFLPPAKGVTRWETLFHLVIFEPQQDGTTLVQSFTQCDPKLPVVAKTMIDRLIVRKAMKWYNNLIKYLDAELDNE